MQRTQTSGYQPCRLLSSATGVQQSMDAVLIGAQLFLAALSHRHRHRHRHRHYQTVQCKRTAHQLLNAQRFGTRHTAGHCARYSVLRPLALLPSSSTCWRSTAHSTAYARVNTAGTALHRGANTRSRPRQHLQCTCTRSARTAYTTVRPSPQRSAHRHIATRAQKSSLGAQVDCRCERAVHASGH